jgi:hypothetical protein
MIKPIENFENSPLKKPDRPSGFFSSNSNMLAIYTILRVLRRMQAQLGLEAMLEYLEMYLKTIEKHNPKLKYAVSTALELMSVEKIYKEALNCDNP